MVKKITQTSNLLHDLQVELRPVAELKPYSGNARTHSKKQIAQIAESIRTFGFVNPVLIDRDGGIVAGHGRVSAAKPLGMTEVPTIRLHHLTDAQRRAYIITDNRLAEVAGWDKEILAIELQHLIELDLDFDIRVTGFETPEIDLLIQGVVPEEDPDNAVPDIDESVPTVSRRGDLWLSGNHRIVCADARESTGYEQLMGEEQARIIFTDPPYNVPISGHVCGLGAVQHDEFTMATGEMSETEFTVFLSTVLALLARFSTTGSLHYVCMDWRHMAELVGAGKTVYSDLKNVCVWNKDNGGMGSLYRSKHELIFVFKQGNAPHVNNVELGRYGRYRTNVWDYPGVNSFHEGRQEDLAMHPTVKPVALVADAILDASHRGDLVLDAFGGSGTTLIAAERTGRRARLIEIDPRYVDVTVQRWEQVTGGTAIHAGSGLSFGEMAATRTTEAPALAMTDPQIKETIDE